MSDIIRCPKCLGAKQYSSLGLIFVECDECGGIGHVTLKISKPVIEESEIGKTQVKTRKRVRKPVEPVLHV